MLVSLFKKHIHFQFLWSKHSITLKKNKSSHYLQPHQLNDRFVLEISGFVLMHT